MESVLAYLVAGWTNEQILDNFPTLRVEDIRACLAYAHEVVDSERMYLLESA